MKLTAKVTALRTNGRMEITITTSATGLEQCITADNNGYSLDQELVLLILTQKQVKDIVWELDDSGVESKGSGYLSITEMVDQLRPDEPPPFLRCGFALGITASQCVLEREHDNTHRFEPQPDAADTQEFAREG